LLDWKMDWNNGMHYGILKKELQHFSIAIPGSTVWLFTTHSQLWLVLACIQASSSFGPHSGILLKVLESTVMCLFNDTFRTYA